MERQISYSQAISGYLLAATARRLSQHTINDYVNTYRKLFDFLEDEPVMVPKIWTLVQAFLGGSLL